MKRLPAILTIVLILGVILSYYTYQHFFTSKEIHPMDLVPTHAVLVVESGGCLECAQAIQHHPVGELIRTTVDKYDSPDSVNRISAFLGGSFPGSLSSLHITGKDNFDLVFYIPMNEGNNAARILSEISVWKSQSGISFSDHEFNGIQIHEAHIKKDTFTWVELKGIWVGSFTPFLVEDVVRVFTQSDKDRFKNSNSELYTLPKVKNDAGNVYVNISKFKEWMSVFKEKSEPVIDFGKSALLDIKSTENSVVMNGFSTVREGTSFLSVFEKQEPSVFDLKNLISNRTFLLENYGFSDGNNFFSALQQMYPHKKDSVDGALASFGVSFSSIYPFAGDNFAVAYLETGTEHISKIGLLETKDPAAWTDVFRKISAASETDDTLFVDQYADYEIREIELPDLPKKIFYPLFSDTGITYYALLDNVIVFTNDLEDLKHFLDDVDNTDTWGRSVGMNKFLESTLLESNVSIYINTPRIWNVLEGYLNPVWRKFLRQKRPMLSQWGAGAIQFSRLSESYYTNVLWQFPFQEEDKKPAVKMVTQIESPLTNRIFRVRNHIDKSNEFLVQDSLKAVYLISSAGKILWKRKLDDYIRGKVTQIDFYKNSKLQYFFTTENKLYIIDRLGNDVSPFPMALPVKKAEFAEVIDYDKSKRYRFLVTTEEGKLWMTDKEGNTLEGWSPNDVGGKLTDGARHYRIGARDYIVLVRTDGWLSVLNRRGEALKNFPKNLDARPTGGYAVEIGKDAAHSFIYMVSRDGFKIKVNFEGKTMSMEPLIKTTIAAKFQLALGADLSSYLVVRQEPAQLSISDRDGQTFIVNPYVGMNAVDVQLFDLGAGRSIVTITDAGQDLSYIYDGHGAMLTSVPIESKAISVFSTDIRNTEMVWSFDQSVSRQMLTLF